jgi:hypothetical protein
MHIDHLKVKKNKPKLNTSCLKKYKLHLTYNQGTCTNLHFEFINRLFLKEKRL